MRIGSVEIQNFRKLKAVRIDFNEQTTLLVGANNSGKTSAMDALSFFLINTTDFNPNDFTLSNWDLIEAIAKKWQEETETDAVKATLEQWGPVLPSLDLWLDVTTNELHHVRHLLPTLSWKGGLIGVRLRFQPKDVMELRKQYLIATKAAENTKTAAEKDGDKKYTLSLWPSSMRSFLERKLSTFFGVQAYLLDPSQRKEPVDGIARIQQLPDGSAPLEGDPLGQLIRVNAIGAQRGLGGASARPVDGDEQGSHSPREKRKLSEQLRGYYSRHLDPNDTPEPADLDALQAIATAETIFDERLEVGFSPALKELASLNYPGVTDPKLKIVTKVRPTDGLNHSAAVQYDISDSAKTLGVTLRLPEEYNGLGYQNLISMVFKLMSFRDAWMRVGKAANKLTSTTAKPDHPAPIHLVLVEEPEAHLHVQVQQVFVRKAYEVLRNHCDLGASPTFQSQLIVSTHSSHVAHEATFECLRYFRRLPSGNNIAVPTSAVINLSDVFASKENTEQFVTRYLRATHCELFFADAVILVEGAAERMLVPHFIREHFPYLHCCFVTLLEIDGSHAHRLKPLIEKLGLTTLIVTDLDAAEPDGHHKSAVPARNAKLITGNDTLTKWHPCKSTIDDLLSLSANERVKTYEMPLFSLCVAYPLPANLVLCDKGPAVEMLATTFEDAFAIANISLFNKTTDTGQVKAFHDAITTYTDPAQLSAALIAAVRSCKKAALALQILYLGDPKLLIVPSYIHEGLSWLETQLKRKESETLSPVAVAEVAGECA